MTASLAPRIQNDFDFGDSELGLAIAICYAVSALSSTPLGRLAERIGAARGMLLATTLTTTSCIAVVTLAQSATSMTALLVLAGPANASTAPAVSALLQGQVAVHRQGLGFGRSSPGPRSGRCSRASPSPR